MNRIKELRISQGMLQKELAVKLGCTAACVSKYELEQSAITPEAINRLCNIFDCSSDYLLGRTAIKNYKFAKKELELIEAYRRADFKTRAIVDLALQDIVQAKMEEIG